MDFERFKEINDTKMNYGEMENASIVSEYKNSACGDTYRIFLKIDEDHPEKKIIDASFTTTGCGFGLAALAMAAEWLKGKSLAQAGEITAADIEVLFEFPERRKTYPHTAALAVTKAIDEYNKYSKADSSIIREKESATTHPA